MTIEITTLIQRGYPGPQGEEGNSAYEVAVSEGFTGNVTAWLASLKGEKGDTGTDVSAFAQISSTVDQVPNTTGNTQVTFNSIDEIENVSYSDGTITILQNGIYNIALGLQVGRTSGSGQRLIDAWVRKNDVDLPNSGVRTAISTLDSMVMMLEITGRYVANNTIKTYMAVDSTVGGVGLYATSLAGRPVIPSAMITITRVSD